MVLLAPGSPGTGEPITHQRCRPYTMARGRRSEGEQSTHTTQAPALAGALQRRWQTELALITELQWQTIYTTLPI